MSESKQRVLMIGGGGFIGVNLCQHLQTTGNFVPVVLDKTEDKLQLRFEGRPYHFVHCDIAKDGGILDREIGRSDIVIHLAAHVRPSTFIKSPLEIVQLNLFGSLQVVEACIRHRRRLIHFSTCEVYGKSGGHDEPFGEDRTDCILGPVANHRWIYSCAKQLVDRIIHAHGLREELEYTIVRPFNFVGPLMDWISASGTDGPLRVFAHFMSALMYGRPLPLVNGGKSRRCFTYIEDALTALQKILENPVATRNQIMNIGNPGNETTIRGLAELMGEIYRREFDPAADVFIEDVNAEDFYGAGYEDCDRRVPDISKLQSLGWSPKCNLEETFSRSMRYCWEHREILLAEV